MKSKDLISEILIFSGKTHFAFKKLDTNIYRVFVGLSRYPDSSNLTSSQFLYKKIKEVAFFSTHYKWELFLIFGILFGDYCEAQAMMNDIFVNCIVNIDDVVKCLAYMHGFYFVNLHHAFFANFIGQFNAQTKIILFSSSVSEHTQLKTILQKNNLQNSFCYLIHPSPKNLANHPAGWIDNYLLTNFNGAINNGMSFLDFLL